MRNFLTGVGAVIFAVVFLAAGIFCIVLGANKIHKVNSGKYVETQAVVTKIDVTEVYDEDSPDNIRKDYVLTVEYSVDGASYVGKLSETPDNFHEGMELTVVYNVDDPTDVTLPGVGGAYILIGLGVFAVLISGVMVLQKMRGR